MNASMISGLLALIATIDMAAAQTFQVIRSEIPQGGGRFGMACAVDANRLAIRSNELDFSIPTTGRVVTYERCYAAH